MPSPEAKLYDVSSWAGRHPRPAAIAPGGSMEPAIRTRAVIFDLFHTLVDLKSAAPGSGTPEILGVDPRQWIRQVIEESPHHALGTIRDPYESVRMIAHAIDPTIPEERIRKAVATRPRRFRAALTQVRPEILTALQTLRDLRLKLGLISNAALDEVDDRGSGGVDWCGFRAREDHGRCGQWGDENQRWTSSLHIQHLLKQPPSSGFAFGYAVTGPEQRHAGPRR